MLVGSNFRASTSTDRGYSPHNIHIQSFASIQFDRTTIIILLSIICAPLIEGIRCELLFCENWKWFGSTQLTRTKAFLIWGVISLSLCLALCGTSIMTLPEIKIENPTLENNFSVSLPPEILIDDGLTALRRNKRAQNLERHSSYAPTNSMKSLDGMNIDENISKILWKMFQRPSILRTQRTWFMLELLGDQTNSIFW